VLGLLLGATLFLLQGPAQQPEPAASTPVRAEEAWAPVAGAAPAAGERVDPAPSPSAAASDTGLQELGAEAEDGPQRHVLAAPVYHPRPAEEWQGMLVDLSLQPGCDRPDGCGLAMACIAGRCGPCRIDGECAAGESCVLDHCVPGAGVGCRSVSDCAEDEVCVLSGYSPGPRGNDALTAYCQTRSGGVEDEDEPRPEPPFDAQPIPRPVSAGALRESLRLEVGEEGAGVPKGEPGAE
jgi:hypothetical protein